MIKPGNILADVKLVSLCTHGDSRGALIALESERDLPFKIQRVYYIYGTKTAIARGCHAHRSLKQLLIAVTGLVKIRCEYCGRKENFTLDRPEKGLFLEGLVWHEMYDFSEDCVLLVLASDFYSEDDYVRNYEDFKKMVMV